MHDHPSNPALAAFANHLRELARGTRPAPSLLDRGVEPIQLHVVPSEVTA
jgi:hypothetical protein